MPDDALAKRSKTMPIETAVVVSAIALPLPSLWRCSRGPKSRRARLTS